MNSLFQQFQKFHFVIYLTAKNKFNKSKDNINSPMAYACNEA